MRAPGVGSGQVFRWAFAAASGVAAVFVLLAALWAVRGMLVLVLLSLFAAISLDPAVRFLVHRGIKRPWAVTLVVTVVLIVVTALVLSITPPLLSQARQIPTDMPGYIASLDERSRTFRELSERYGLGEHLNRLAASIPDRVGSSVLSFFQRFVSLVSSLLIIAVLTIYFMADLPRLRLRIPRLLPSAYRGRAHQVIDVIVDKVGAYMIGNLAVSAVAGVVTYAGLSALRVPFALPLALWVALTDLIPLIGAVLGAIPCVLVAVIANGIWPTAILVLALIVAYQQVENYLIAPRIMTSSLNMSALAVLVAGLLGAALLGLVGALIAIPIAAVVKVVAAEFTPPDAAHPAPGPPPGR